MPLIFTEKRKVKIWQLRSQETLFLAVIVLGDLAHNQILFFGQRGREEFLYLRQNVLVISLTTLQLTGSLTNFSKTLAILTVNFLMNSESSLGLCAVKKRETLCQLPERNTLEELKLLKKKKSSVTG